MARRQPHSLKSFRKENALTQDETAFLLGSKTGTQISQYERFQRAPSAENILTYQIIFGVSADKLLPVLYNQVEQETNKRAHTLAETIRSGEMNANAERKLKLLNDIINRTVDTPATLPWEKKTLAAS